jgi:hypothetical protein
MAAWNDTRDIIHPKWQHDPQVLSRLPFSMEHGARQFVPILASIQLGQRASPLPFIINEGQAVLWNNTGKNGEFQAVAIERSYKDGDDWKMQKISLNADDLISVARGLEKGHDAIVEADRQAAGPRPLRAHEGACAKLS